MKKLLLLTSLLLIPIVIPVQAQDDDITTQIEQLQNEIIDIQAKISELRQELNTEDTVEFDYEGLTIRVQIELTPYEGDQSGFDDTYIILHLSVENTTDTAIKFDPDGFNMYLADVIQSGVNVYGESMEIQAIPGNTTVEGLVHFNVTEAVANDKDLIVRYEPSDTIFVGESVFEFKVNDYKFINGDTESVEEEEEVTFTPVEDTTETAMNYEETTNCVEPLDYPSYADEGTYEVTDEAIFYKVDGVQYIETDVYKGPLINPQGPEVPYDELTD